MADAYVNAPGARLQSCDGTAFGLLQAVAFYLDHRASIRDVDGDGEQISRLASSWFGAGEKMKQDARELIREMVYA